MNRTILCLAAGALLAGPVAAAPPRDPMAEITDGRVAGAPVRCIQLSLLREESRTIPHRAVAYRAGSTWYVANFENGCPQLDWNTFTVTRPITDRLCQGDIAELRDNGGGIFRGTCIFDSFTPYTRPKDQRR